MYNDIMQKKNEKIVYKKKSEKKQERSFSAIVWQTHEFSKFDPWTGWYVAITLMATLVIGTIFYFHVYTLLVGLFLIVLLIVLEISLEPRLVRVEVNDLEIKFGEKKFSYTKIKSYSITKLREKKHLVLKTTMPLMSLVDIPLGKQTEEELRNFLNKQVPYCHIEKHPVDRLIFWR